MSSFFNIPIKLKFKKFRKRVTFSSQPETTFSLGVRKNSAFLKAVGFGRLSSSHLEAARKVLRRKLRKTGMIRAHVFPLTSITKKPLAVRMGKGRGAVDSWIFPIRPGRIIFEIYDAPSRLGAEALLLAKKKLPVAARVIINNEII